MRRPRKRHLLMIQMCVCVCGCMCATRPIHEICIWAHIWLTRQWISLHTNTHTHLTHKTMSFVLQNTETHSRPIHENCICAHIWLTRQCCFCAAWACLGGPGCVLQCVAVCWGPEGSQKTLSCESDVCVCLCEVRSINEICIWAHFCIWEQIWLTRQNDFLWDSSCTELVYRSLFGL